MFALTNIIFSAPTEKFQKIETAFNDGTVRPPESGTYQLGCGAYARFYNGHWRARNASLEAAAEEERLDTFAQPTMRHLGKHKWRPIAKAD